MKRKTSVAGKRQVNLRLPDEEVNVLEAIAFLDRKSSVQEVVSQIVRGHVESRAQEPELQTALRLRAEYEGKRSGKVRRITERSGTVGRNKEDR